MSDSDVFVLLINPGFGVDFTMNRSVWSMSYKQHELWYWIEFEFIGISGCESSYSASLFPPSEVVVTSVRRTH